MTPYEIDLLNYMIVSNLILRSFWNLKNLSKKLINYFQSIFQNMWYFINCTKEHFPHSLGTIYEIQAYGVFNICLKLLPSC